MMNHIKKLLFLLSIVIVCPLMATAASYSLVSGANCGSGSTCPVCTGGSWSRAGANFTCSGSISFAGGDTVASSVAATITANSSIALNNNTIGSAAQNISLISSTNTITTTGNSSVFGSITANSAVLSLTGGSVSGSVASSCCTITTNGTVIGGAITATNGTISITGGSVGGAVTSGCCTITANSTVISGSISASGAITLTNSAIGSSTSPVNVTSSNGSITLNSSTNAYGTLTAPSWSTVNVNSGSTVSGTCIPNSTPANACNSSPVLLGSWRMDELSWDGTAAEVKDSSGSGNHGKASVAVVGNSTPSTTSGNPAYTVGSKSTCRYAAFDGTGSPTRVYNYVELSGFPTLPNGFTFAAWIRSSNASAQHQRILVRDDAQNGWGLSLADGTSQPKLRFFARNITNNGAVTGQGSDPSCGVFCVDTNAVLTSNAWYYVASVIDTSAKTVTLYVYNASGVLQAKATGAYSGTWTDGTGTAAIGGETSASGEGTQTSWHFLGNIDEVNIYSGALSQTSIESLLTTVRTCPAPDHYELDMSATSLTCLGSNVTVRVCADSVSPCTNIDYTINSNVTLAASAGSLNATTLTLASGIGTTKLLFPAATDSTLASVTLSGEATAAINARKCCVGGSCTVANSCTTTFKTAGFIFPNTTTGTTNNIANATSGIDGTAYLRALQTNATTGACTARFSSPQTVKMAFKCVNPTSCITGEILKLNNTSVPSNSNIASPIVYGDVSLSFDANGSAPIPINYSDAGQIQLFASLALPPAAGEPAYTLTGSSNLFVVKPYDIQITSVQTSSGGSNPKTTNAGAGFVASGAAFKVSAQAYSYYTAATLVPHVTPNFGLESSPENVGLQISALINPGTGNTGALANAGAFTKSGTTFNNSTLNWNEVGTIALKASIGDGDYLGAGNVISLQAVNVGRFYPDHFEVVSKVASQACVSGSFTYMEQPAMTVNYKLQAENTAGVAVTNYSSSYSPTLATPVYSVENADAGSNLNTLNGGVDRFTVSPNTPAPTWILGVLDVLPSTAKFARLISSAKVVPDGPFESSVVGLKLTDALDSRTIQASDLNTNPATVGACLPSCTDAILGSGLKFRFGRLRLDDAFGPETVTLPVNFYTEYWTGNHFTLNAQDSCTLVPRAAITYPSGSIAVDSNRTVNLTGGSTTGTYGIGNGNLTATDVKFFAGVAGQSFSAPTNAAQGSFVVGVDLTNLSWLTFDWDQGKTLGPDTKLPNATFSFGSYRGNDRIIYWREKLQ